MEPQRVLLSVPTCLLLLSVRLTQPSYVPVAQTCSVGNLAFFEMTGYTLSVLRPRDTDQVVLHIPAACQQASRDHAAFACASYSYSRLTSFCGLYKYRPGEGGAVLQVPSQGATSYTYYVSYCEQTTVHIGSLIGCYALRPTTNLAIFAFTGIYRMTPQLCHKYCLHFRQSTYSGALGGKSCYCGEPLASFVGSLSCSSPCTGDVGQTCGGSHSIQVYAVCGRKKFGANCDQSCNCVDQDVCPRTTGACTKPCPAGYGGISCQVCPADKWGTGCGSDCNTNCKVGTCDPATGKCTQGCIVGFSGDTCTIEGIIVPTDTEDTGCPSTFLSWLIPTIALGLVVLVAAIVITVLLKRLSSEHPEKGKRERTNYGADMTTLGMNANTFKLDQPRERAYEEIRH